MTKRDRLTTTDVTVVGASGSGLLAARLLAEAGKTVRVLERANSLNPATRSLIVTPRILEVLGAETQQSVVGEVRRFELYANGSSALVPLRDPDLIVERSKVIRSLARAAEDAGVEILYNHRFQDVAPIDGGLRLRFQNGTKTECDTRMLIGADGAMSKVARAGGWPVQRSLPLIQAITSRPEDMDPFTSRVWFEPNATPYFFWSIPYSRSQMAIGVIGEPGDNVRDVLDRFLESHRIDVIEYQAARVPLYTKWVPVHKRMGAGDVFLVGDAAGQVKVSTVGGLVTGLRGAVGVVESIVHGRSAELRSLKRELDLHLLVRKVMHRFDDGDYDRLLGMMDVSVAKSVGKHDRDSALRVLSSMALKHPRLAVWFVRCLARSRSLPEPEPAIAGIGARVYR
jgi:flavin-dependent dehydrogenase